MKILIAGDFAPKDRLKKKLDSDMDDILADVSNIISTHDYSIVNLEAPIVNTSREISIKINLSANENTIKCLKNAGFTCVTLANNHFRDFLDDGVLNTLKVLQENNIDYVGGGKNLIEAQKPLRNSLSGGGISQ